MCCAELAKSCVFVSYGARKQQPLHGTEREHPAKARMLGKLCGCELGLIPDILISQSGLLTLDRTAARRELPVTMPCSAVLHQISLVPTRHEETSPLARIFVLS